MYSAFSLLNAINESGTGVVASSSVEAYPFTGMTLTESIREGVNMVLAEAADIVRFNTGADEIMVEAAMGNPETLDALSEGAWQTITDGFTKFWEKMKAIVKGIIVKIQAFFAKLTNKTNKWCSLMEKRIKDADRRAGNGDLEAEMYEWETDYVIDGMAKGCATLLEQWDKTWGSQNIGTVEQKVQDLIKNMPRDPDAFHNDKRFDDAKKEIKEDNTNGTDKIQETVCAQLNSALDVDGTDVSDAIHKITAKAKGHGGEKVTVKYGSKTGAMFDAVKNCSKTLTTLKKTYEDYLKKLNKCSEISKKTAHIQVEDKDNLPAGAKGEIEGMVRAYVQQIVQWTSAYHSAIDSVRANNISMMQSMAQDYMTILTRYANAKAPKKEA